MARANKPPSPSTQNHKHNKHPQLTALPSEHPALIEAVTAAINAVGRNLVVGAPLGIGKPNPLLNAFYQRALDEPDIQLNIFTALSLAVPPPGKGLRGRFAAPFLKRQFGENYPHLVYLKGQRQGNLPANISITEFYLQPGSMLHKPLAQRHYINSNYTHVARDMEARGVNVICQMVALRQTENGARYSLSSNPDVTLDLADRMRRLKKKCFIIGMVNNELPYMAGDAEVTAEFFDHIIDDSQLFFAPYAVPRAPVSVADHAIGLHASTLIRDGGTLQIGIGSLGDALCHALILRHRETAVYHRLIDTLEFEHDQHLIRDWGGLEPFSLGLYAASEMFLDGFVHLYEADILKRHVYDDERLQELLNKGLIEENISPLTLINLHKAGLIDSPPTSAQVDWMRYWGILQADVEEQNGGLILPDGRHCVCRPNDDDDFSTAITPFLGKKLAHGRLLHAAFFLGSHWFYQALRHMDDVTRDQFAMCRVSRINQLYEGEAIDRLQRLEARFLNTCMKMTLLGAAVSDGLADGQVVSGVGGQYNFVAMGHALHRGRSILMLRSTRESKGKTESNVVWEYPHNTIPRHLKDIVITEYGIADLRGKTDEEVIQALIAVSDARFQDELLAQAREAGKIDPRWQLPDWARRNTPEQLKQSLKSDRQSIPEWPFGSDFNDLEKYILPGLQWLAGAQAKQLLRAFMAGGEVLGNEERENDWSRHLGFDNSWRDRFMRRLLRGALRLASSGGKSST